MSAPHPDVIRRLTTVSVDHLKKACADYSYLYASGFQRSGNGSGDRVATSGVADLSGLMTGDVAQIRKDVEEAARSLFEAERRIEVAQARLNDAASRIDAGKPVEVSIHERAVEHPADRGDVRRAQNAQKRRNDRVTRRVLPWSQSEVTG